MGDTLRFATLEAEAYYLRLLARTRPHAHTLLSCLVLVSFVRPFLPGSSSEKSRPVLPSFVRAQMALVTIFTHTYAVWPSMAPA